MLGIVIIDDDAIVRTNLKSVIDWEKEGYRILGEAENGEKGLELILRDKPDIVITDIKMPVMDGLEMIRSARKEYDKSRYVILSSYEEFGLLKTAMDYGITDYLLKLELSPDILKKTLENQKRIILYENNSVQEREISPYSRVAVALRRVLAGYYLEDDLADTLKLANPKIDKDRLSCIAVRFSLPDKGLSLGEGDRRTIEMAAHSTINNITRQYFAGISFLEDTGLCLFVYSPVEGKNRITEMGGIIINMLKQYLNLNAAVGISSFEGGIQDISRIMIDAVKATDEVFYRGYGTIIRSSEVRGEAAGSAAIFDWEDPFRKALELRRSEDLKGIFKDMHGILAPPVRALIRNPLNSDPVNSGSVPPPAPRISKTEAFNLCFSLVSAAFSVFASSNTGKSPFTDNQYEVIGKIETLEGLREWLKTFEASILDWRLSIQERSHDDMMAAEVKNYVAKNFSKPIGLNEAAEHLGLSSGYLSSLFKRCTGLGFVEYVTGVKMAEAKKLIRSGQYRIGEVSEMVGYEDTGYFSKTFHKITGLSPKEYMTRHI
ncbi:hypothetical protein FACS1894110_04720 [Spirochaetia bacterium]|nr:hypothetical protein FACS1894110_04720 [Spirochaetia bacterium]